MTRKRSRKQERGPTEPQRSAVGRRGQSHTKHALFVPGLEHVVSGLEEPGKLPLPIQHTSGVRT